MTQAPTLLDKQTRATLRMSVEALSLSVRCRRTLPPAA
jgi:hypothetical protein